MMFEITSDSMRQACDLRSCVVPSISWGGQAPSMLFSEFELNQAEVSITSMSGMTSGLALPFPDSMARNAMT